MSSRQKSNRKSSSSSSDSSDGEERARLTSVTAAVFGAPNARRLFAAHPAVPDPFPSNSSAPKLDARVASGGGVSLRPAGLGSEERRGSRAEIFAPPFDPSLPAKSSGLTPVQNLGGRLLEKIFLQTSQIQPLAGSASSGSESEEEESSVRLLVSSRPLQPVAEVGQVKYKRIGSKLVATTDALERQHQIDRQNKEKLRIAAKEANKRQKRGREQAKARGGKEKEKLRIATKDTQANKKKRKRSSSSTSTSSSSLSSSSDSDETSSGLEAQIREAGTVVSFDLSTKRFSAR